MITAANFQALNEVAEQAARLKDAASLVQVIRLPPLPENTLEIMRYLELRRRLDVKATTHS